MVGLGIPLHTDRYRLAVLIKRGLLECSVKVGRKKTLHFSEPLPVASVRNQVQCSAK